MGRASTVVPAASKSVSGDGAAAARIEIPTFARDGALGPDPLLRTEWLLTNGLGGFAMGTALGVPTRRYHGLLIAATTPPVGRVLALHSMIETLVIGAGEGRAIDLSTFEFRGSPPVLHPHGWTHLKRFEKDLTVRWVFETDGLRVTKELGLVGGANSAVLVYRLERLEAGAGSGGNTIGKRSGGKLSRRLGLNVEEPATAARLIVRPLAALRDFHGLIRRAGADRFDVQAEPRGAKVSLDGRTMHLASDAGRFAHDQQWWYDFFYRAEADRAQDCLEDLFSPGSFVTELGSNQYSAGICISASLALSGGAAGGCAPIGPALLEDARARRKTRIADHAEAILGAGEHARGDRRIAATLACAADDFVVVRAARAAGARAGVGVTGGANASIIAGYPWFSDWGRDTFIALPGLMLATGRFAEARRALESFGAARRNGIIPNVFDERTGEPEYNTVDASLWYIRAACEYLRASGDRAGFDAQMRGACLDVVAAYRKGTDFNIAMDPHDHLIAAGSASTQLTWMDARRDGVTFTPRQGKPVEVNALWCSVLRMLGEAVGPDDAVAGANLKDLADAASRSFRAAFWNGAKSCLFDCLSPGEGGAGYRGVDEVRPNQIFAVSLPHSPLSREQQAAVVTIVRDRLLTPLGVRTLDPTDPKYRGRYRGSLFERDGAYHQGTAWPWLVGPLAEATMRVGGFSLRSRSEALAMLEPLIVQLDATEWSCPGQLPEVADGDGTPDSPRIPGGCPAQAWSIAETLRAWKLARSTTGA